MTFIPPDADSERLRELAQGEWDVALHALGENRSGEDLIAGSRALLRREALLSSEIPEEDRLEHDAWRRAYAEGLWRVSCVTDDAHERVRFGEYALLTAAEIREEPHRARTMRLLTDIDPRSLETAAILIPRSGSWMIQRLGESTASLLREYRSPRAEAFERLREHAEMLDPLPPAKPFTRYARAMAAQLTRDLTEARQTRERLSDSHGKAPLPKNQGARLQARLDLLDGEEALYADAPNLEGLPSLYDEERKHVIRELAWHDPQAARIAIDGLSDRIYPQIKLMLLSNCYDRDPEATTWSMLEYVEQFESDPHTQLELVEQAERFFLGKVKAAPAKKMRKLRKRLQRAS